MTSDERFFGSPPGFTEGRSVFADLEHRQRMDAIRLKILEIRKGWSSSAQYDALKHKVRDFVKADERSEEVAELLEELLKGFRDYADMDLDRPARHQIERYPALELYCTNEGYKYLYQLVYQALRQDDVDNDLLVTVVTLVEYLTIDLYNLRLANIGDPSFANFQGITYRGMRVTPEAAEDYRKVFQNQDLSKRSFSIPLGLMSSSSEIDTMKSFAQDSCDDVKTEKMFLTIHIHGVDEDLLSLYLSHYPTSVVTTICALPVGRISMFAEQEVLLRGAFFHMIDMRTRTSPNGKTHEIICVVINANRDHTSEDGSNEGSKKTQRNLFRHIVAASRYEVCAELCRSFSVQGAEAYSVLQSKELEAIRDLQEEYFGIEPKSPADKVIRNTDLAMARSTAKSTWLGGSTFDAYPRPYYTLRCMWEDAVSAGEWERVESILTSEYTWSRKEWYNVGHIPRGLFESPLHSGYTLVHEIALQGPPKENSEAFDSWQRLVQEAATEESWKTLRTFDDKEMTAHEIALSNGYKELAKQLTPQIKHPIPLSGLQSLQIQVHNFMREKAGALIKSCGFRLPQLSVLTEMAKPSLWVPIPNMFGGFLIELKGTAIYICAFETVPGYYQPQITEKLLRPDLGESKNIN